jgi:pheromone shutdown protein TraB
MSAAFENAVLLQHPCGTRVLLLGTSHVSARHGSYVSEAIERCQPRSVVLEIDEVSFVRLPQGLEEHELVKASSSC